MKLSTKIRIFIIFLIIAFIAIAACALTEYAGYISDIFAEYGDVVSETTVYFVGALLCLPCVAILLIALGIAGAVERDEVFSALTAKALSLISVIFFTDCSVFFAATVAIMAFGERFLYPVLILVALVGIAISVLLRVLSGYIRRAAELKEEVDTTL